MIVVGRLDRLIVTQFATKNSGGEHIHHVWEWTMKGMYVKSHLHMTKTDQNNQMRFTFLCLANGLFRYVFICHIWHVNVNAPWQ